MSFAFKCDRCNTFTQSQPKIIQAHPEEEYKTRRYELCQSCWHDFESYLIPPARER